MTGFKDSVRTNQIDETHALKATFVPHLNDDCCRHGLSKLAGRPDAIFTHRERCCPHRARPVGNTDCSCGFPPLFIPVLFPSSSMCESLALRPSPNFRNASLILFAKPASDRCARLVVLEHTRRPKPLSIEAESRPR